MGSKKNGSAGKIFLSHSHKDAALANAIASATEEILSSDPGSLFFVASDENRSIAHGESIVSNIKESLKGSRAVVTLLTEHSHNRPWIHFEAGAGAVLSKTIPVAFPGCPRDQTTLYFQDAKGIDLREWDDLALQNLFKALAQAIGRGDSDRNARMFAERLGKYVDGYETTDQVAAVCFRLSGVTTREILLVRTLDGEGQERIPGNQRLFPKTPPRFGGKRVYSDSVAAIFAALTEAGVAVSIRGDLGTFKHWKEDKQRELTVKAILAEFVETDPSNSVKPSNPRAPGWFSKEEALEHVGANRTQKYAWEYQRIIQDAFRAI